MTRFRAGIAILIAAVTMQLANTSVVYALQVTGTSKLARNVNSALPLVLFATVVQQIAIELELLQRKATGHTLISPKIHSR